MAYIGNTLPTVLLSTDDIVDQAITTAKLSATGGTNGQFLVLDANLNLDWSSGSSVSSLNDLSDAVTYDSGASIGLGTGALANDDGSSNNNTAVGYQAANALTTGSLSVAVGYQALKTITTGHSNVALGYQAMYNTGTGVSECVAIGREAQRQANAANNISIGYYSHYGLTSGGSNISIGSQAGYSQTTGNANVCIGTSSFDAATTASNSVAVGTRALGANTTADANHAFGYEALENNTTGTDNTAVGYQALESNTTGVKYLNWKSGWLQPNDWQCK